MSEFITYLISRTNTLKLYFFKIIVIHVTKIAWQEMITRVNETQHLHAVKTRRTNLRWKSRLSNIWRHRRQTVARPRYTRMLLFQTADALSKAASDRIMSRSSSVSLNTSSVSGRKGSAESGLRCKPWPSSMVHGRPIELVDLRL